jgi:hypothetical protein
MFSLLCPSFKAKSEKQRNQSLVGLNPGFFLHRTNNFPMSGNLGNLALPLIRSIPYIVNAKPKKQ